MDMNMRNQNSTVTNFTSSLSSPEYSIVYSDSIKYLVGAWYCVMSVLGLALVLLVMLIIIKIKGIKMSPFYIFLINLCIADASLFILYICYVVLCVVTSSQLYGIIDGFSVMGFIEGVIYMTIVCNSFLISVNRFLCICYPFLEPMIFTRKISIALSLLTWCVGLLVNSLNIVMSCFTSFNEKKFTFSTVCTKIISSLSFGSFIIYICVYGVAFFYALIAGKFWKRKKSIGVTNQQISQNMTKRQMNLFFQALCIWLSLLSNAIGFRILPFVLTGLPAAMFSTILLVSPSYVTSICVLVFSKDIRRGMKNFTMGNKLLFAAGSVSNNHSTTAF